MKFDLILSVILQGFAPVSAGAEGDRMTPDPGRHRTHSIEIPVFHCLIQICLKRFGKLNEIQWLGQIDIDSYLPG